MAWRVGRPVCWGEASQAKATVPASMKPAASSSAAAFDARAAIDPNTSGSTTKTASCTWLASEFMAPRCSSRVMLAA
eukprot:430724-Prymnesium_polylepis.1